MATAEVTITDAAVVREAAARAEEDAVTIGFSDAPDNEDIAAESHSAGTADDAFDTLAWLIWPTNGLGSLLDVGAVRILEMTSEWSFALFGSVMRRRRVCRAGPR